MMLKLKMHSLNQLPLSIVSVHAFVQLILTGSTGIPHRLCFRSTQRRSRTFGMLLLSGGSSAETVNAHLYACYYVHILV